jgi:hypothetical protein
MSGGAALIGSFFGLSATNHTFFPPSGFFMANKNPVTETVTGFYVDFFSAITSIQTEP